MPKRLPKELNDHKFQPGVSGNPNGRPKLTPLQREARTLTLESLRNVIEVVLTGTLQDLKELIEDPKTPAVQVGIATAILKSIKSGDPTVLERFCERLVGKIPDKIEVINNTQINQQVTVIDRVALRAAIDKLENDV